MTRRLTAFVAAVVLTALTNAADARQKTISSSQSLYDQRVMPVYQPQYQGRLYKGPGLYQKRHKAKTAKRKSPKQYAPRLAHSKVAQHGHATRILPHPAGCPARAFCGCGVSQRLLGRTVTAGGLAIAANWGGFPRTGCAPGMAAFRPGHVYAIEQCLGGNRVLAYDPNSGGRLTRLHVRSLAGYQIVNPHGAYTEVNGKPGRVYRTRYAKRYKRTRYAVAG